MCERRARVRHRLAPCLLVRRFQSEGLPDLGLLTREDLTPRTLACDVMGITFTLVVLTAQTGTLSLFTEKRQGARLGDEVLIPCTDHHDVSGRDIFQWIYRKDPLSKPVTIAWNLKSGIQYRHTEFWREKKMLRNFSLVITNFREVDQGTYWCQLCRRNKQCSYELKTLFLLEGWVAGLRGGRAGPSVVWTFQRFGETSAPLWTPRRQPDASIHILDVRPSDAGTYTCWRQESSGHRQGLLALSLCVLTAGPVGPSPGSPLNCSLRCDSDWELVGPPHESSASPGAGPVVVETGNVTFQVHESPEKRERTVQCRAREPGEAWVENSTTHGYAENNQEDNYVNPQTLLLCVSLASAFVALAIFLGVLFLCRQRIRAAYRFADEPRGDVLFSTRTRDAKPETDEVEVVYSLLEFRQPEKEQVLVGEEGCVYNGGSARHSNARYRRDHQHDGVSPARQRSGPGVGQPAPPAPRAVRQHGAPSFADHETVYLLRGQQGNPFLLRARRSLTHLPAPCHLRYLGQPEAGDKSRHALVRNCVDVSTSHSLPEFLGEMGFRVDHEFVARGRVFRRGALKVVVSKLFRVLVPGNVESTEPLSLSNLVELSVLAPAGQDNVSDDMRAFAEQLRPLVHLEKIDPKRHM
ncbi:hypothetical protein COCON_G00019020 [Conger conger]|uniref:Immunoglobulin domain-containing protein n=1 Tax=Conger conger TaxID=82655 RepID=A0A9Q1I9V7_CONCO|nr:hypothetical protein COCON_G00019020 [Conger conger]